MTGSDDLLAAYRAVVRETNARFERAIRVIHEDQRLQREESRRYFEILDAQSAREDKRIDELIEENRAQRQALLRMLDRLDNGGAASAT